MGPDGSDVLAEYQALRSGLAASILGDTLEAAALAYITSSDALPEGHRFATLAMLAAHIAKIHWDIARLEGHGAKLSAKEEESLQMLLLESASTRMHMNDLELAHQDIQRSLGPAPRASVHAKSMARKCAMSISALCLFSMVWRS